MSNEIYLLCDDLHNDGHTYREISDMFNVSVETARNWVGRGEAMRRKKRQFEIWKRYKVPDLRRRLNTGQ